MKYIIDSRYFDGACLTSMSDGLHSDFGGGTLEELKKSEDNPHLIAITPGRMALLVKRYTRALCKPFREITEERYGDLRDCLPPACMGNGWFFVGEPYYGNLYPLCFRSGGRFFIAERPSVLPARRLPARFVNTWRKRTGIPPLSRANPSYIMWNGTGQMWLIFHTRLSWTGKNAP